MAKSLADELGTRLSSIEARLNALAGNRLDHASLDGTTLWLKDSDGNLQGRLGRQPDGSNGVHVVRVQPPPQLTAAILTVGEQAGTCLVEWDGGTFDGRRMPLIHGHTEIWAELVGEDWSPTVAPGEPAKRVGTIRDRTGGEVVVALPQAGTWAVWLRAMGADRETAGPWSPVATVEIVPLVDTEAIEQELEDARQQIEDADQRLTAGQNALTGHLDNLNDVRLPALEQDISNAVSQATADIQDFESRWDDQWDNTIPALSSRQDTLVGELADGLTQVHNQAEALAEAARDEAVSMAAADAQSEYDRLQEIAERALSRAGDNVLEDPSFEADYWVNEWNGMGGRIVRHTGLPRSGSRALVIEGGSTVDLPLPDVNVDPDQTYRFQVWQRTFGDDPDFSGGTRLQILDSDTGQVLEESDIFTAGITYLRAHVAYQVSNDVASIRPVVRVTHPEGILILDDMSVQEVGAAAEALRQAEVARQEAEAAHIAAGEATDAAALAYDAASSKSTVHWSLSAPSGTADNTDDIWWQYEVRNGKRVVIGQWFWDDGVWRETEIAEEWLPLVNIGTGTYGDLTGDRLTANTVTTRHLAVGDFTNLFPEEALEDLHDNGLASPGWSAMAEGANGFTTLTDQGGMPVVLRWNGPVPENGDTARLQFAPGGEGMAVRPGETVILSGYGWRASGSPGNVGVRFAYRDADGGHVSWGDSFTGHIFESGWNEFEFIETVPDDDRIRLLTVDFYGQTDSNRGHWGNFSLRRMVDGKMVVDGSLQARHVDMVDFTADEGFIDSAFVNLIQGRMANFDEALIGGVLLKEGAVGLNHLTSNTVVIDALLQASTAELQELFFDTAVGNAIWAEAVRSRLVESQGIITEDMIATGAITTPKLTVTEEMVGEVVKVMRLEGDEMDFNVIRGMIIEAALIEGSIFLATDADGNETVRLDGMDNYLRGSIHAGVSDDAEIRMDYGQKRRNRGLTDEGEPANPWWVQTPYFEFHDDRHNYRDDGEPSIFLDDGEDSRSPGQMVINPGYPEGTPAFRGTLNVVGDVASNRSHTRESFSSNGGLYINHSNPNYEGGIFSSGNDTRILGRHHGADHSRGQTSFWRSNQYSLASGGQRRRSFTWGSPPPTGVRSPILSVQLSSAASDRNAYVVANSSSISAAGYNINEHNISSASATYYTLQLAVWETG